MNPIKTSIMLITLSSLISCSSLKKSEQQKKGLDTDPKPPLVTMPEVRKLWVPDKIEGNKFETGHYIYILEKTSTWSQSNDK